MVSFRTVQPKITRIVQVHAIVEKIAGVNGPLCFCVALLRSVADFPDRGGGRWGADSDAISDKGLN